MQLSFLFGLTAGYPLTDKFKQTKLVFWILSGATFISTMATFFTLDKGPFTQNGSDSSFRISLLTVLFKKVHVE